MKPALTDDPSSPRSEPVADVRRTEPVADVRRSEPTDASRPGAPAAGHSMRIGEVAELTGTTPRTIRYYEEIGLLAGGLERELGKHRCYSTADVERVKEIVRLKELLGLSLDELSQLLEAESARAEIRREFKETEDPALQRELLGRSLAHIKTQLGLVQARIAELAALERDLSARHDRVGRRLAELQSLAKPDPK